MFVKLVGRDAGQAGIQNERPAVARPRELFGVAQQRGAIALTAEGGVYIQTGHVTGWPLHPEGVEIVTVTHAPADTLIFEKEEKAVRIGKHPPVDRFGLRPVVGAVGPKLLDPGERSFKIRQGRVSAFHARRPLTGLCDRCPQSAPG